MARKNQGFSLKFRDIPFPGIKQKGTAPATGRRSVLSSVVERVVERNLFTQS